MDLKLEFCRLASLPSANLSELCRRYAISRPTAYRYLDRYRQQGPSGLAERSRRPLSSPAKTGSHTQAYLLALKDQYPFWGAFKLLAILDRDRLEGLHACPPCSRSAAERILRQAGLVSPQRQAAATALPQRFEREQPNQLWQMDFKGHVPITQGGRCHPLVIVDDHSRFCLTLQALPTESTQAVRQALTACFERHGLPEAILCDNGGVWASTHGPSLKEALQGRAVQPGTWQRSRSLSTLEAWLIALGIQVLHGAPYHPQTQGKCERFNQTLNQEVLQGRIRSSLADYQQVFDAFRNRYNQVRPHQALDMSLPAQRYRPSCRTLPLATPPPCYPDTYQTYRVALNGCICHNKKRVFIGEGLKGCILGLEPLQESKTNQQIFYYNMPIAAYTPQK